MPHKSKRACQAEAQRASGMRFFDARFTDNVDDYIGDSNYSLDISEDDSENKGWAFSFFEGDGAVAAEDSDGDKWEDEEGDILPVILGSKQKVSGSVMDDSSEDEAIDIKKSSTLKAARTVQQIWSKVFKKVSKFQ